MSLGCKPTPDDDSLRMHAYNYVLMESGIREFCSKCAGCCHNVCLRDGSAHRHYGVGCRNSLCLNHICESLRDLLDGKQCLCTHVDGTLQLLQGIWNECTKKDLKGIKRAVEEVCPETKLKLQKIEERLSRKYVRDTYATRALDYIANCRRNEIPVLAENIEDAAKFDAETVELFNNV